jgi:rhodanese-related sulfurtransferase
MRVKTLLLTLLTLVLSACAAPPTVTSPTTQTASQQPLLFPTFSPVAVEHGDYRQVSPMVLSEGLKAKNFTLVNVHVPYAGEIAHTDAFLQYDQISFHFDQLPDKAAPIVVYCRSGRMSTIAAATLVNAGYTNVWELAGGMDAWKQAGLPLLQKQ